MQRRQRWSRYRRHSVVLLEDAHMERIMDASTCRELEADSHLFDELNDPIGPIVPWLQLAGALSGDGGRGAVAEAQ
jgi:hypothetical protein